MTRDNAKYSKHVEFPKGSLPPKGYLAWHAWAESQHAHGLRQGQCKGCQLWLFPQEVATHSCDFSQHKRPPRR